ncbi:hypothetical protein ml_161 [Mollivirus sibericum]|uniref:hypothetical protein n=1 Tax=Mollivirus sibericum TaxID=1678078 RepID=UPI0006B2E05D|nr:hypothetical protein ml_161 [Mollivirus sibericum]ALD61963.1 hypothetical protein ml_161 [Mollivirus sibericum]
MSNDSHKIERAYNRLRALAMRQDSHVKQFPVIASSLHAERVTLAVSDDVAEEETFCSRLIGVGMEGFRTTRGAVVGHRFVVVRTHLGRSGLPKVVYIRTLGSKGRYHQITWREKQRAWVDLNAGGRIKRLHQFFRMQASGHPLEGRRGTREAANIHGRVFLREHFTVKQVIEADSVTGAPERIAVLYDPEDQEEPETEDLVLDKPTNSWLGHANAVYTILA